MGIGHSSYDLEFRIIQTTYRTATVECHLNDQLKAEVQAETNDASASSSKSRQKHFYRKQPEWMERLRD